MVQNINHLSSIYDLGERSSYQTQNHFCPFLINYCQGSLQFVYKLLQAYSIIINFKISILLFIKLLQLYKSMRQQNWQQQTYGEVMGPLKYQNTANEYESQDKYIAGLTHEDVSQLITSFPFIYHIYKKNKPNDQWKLIDILAKAPSLSDEPGFIYGFMNQQQNSLLQTPYWIKMGRTKSNPPQKRIFQWEKDDQVAITQVFTVRTLYNRKLQALVHALFAYARQNRIINGKKRVQWFQFKQITLTAAAVNILNHLMNTVHTTHLNNIPKVYLNRNLKQLSDKICQSNNQIKDICNSCPSLVVQSFIRDLGLQLARNDEVKLKLIKSQNLEEALLICKDFQIGKQMDQFFKQTQQALIILQDYQLKLGEYISHTFTEIKKIYQKTKVNIVLYDGQKNVQKKLNVKKNEDVYSKDQNKCQPKQKVQNQQNLPYQNQINVAKIKNDEFSSKNKIIQHNIMKNEKKIIYREKYLNNQKSNGKMVQNKSQNKINNSNNKKTQKALLIQQRMQQNKEKVIIIDQQLKQVNIINTKRQQRPYEQHSLSQQALIIQMQHLNIQQDKKYQNIPREYRKQQQETAAPSRLAKGTTYTSQGVKQTQFPEIKLDQVKNSNQKFLKYKKGNEKTMEKKIYTKKSVQKNREKKQNLLINNKSSEQQVDQQVVNTQGQNILNETKSEEQIKQQLQNQNKSQWIFKQYDICKISQLERLQQQNLGKQYLIRARCLYMDSNQFCIQCNYIIMTKKIQFLQNINFRKGSKFKGFARIFCSQVNAEHNLKVEKNCQKYLGMFKVDDVSKITEINNYHKLKSKIDQSIKQLSKQFLTFFSKST